MMRTSRSLSDTTVSSDTVASLEYEVLLETAFGNDELVFLAFPILRDPSERRIHELVGVSPELAVLPFFLEHHHVVSDLNLPRSIPSPSFLVEEIVLGGADTPTTEEKVPADAVTVTETDQLHRFRSRLVFRNGKAHE